MRTSRPDRYGHAVGSGSLLDRARRVDPRRIDLVLTAVAVIAGVGPQLGSTQPDGQFKGTDALAVVLGLVTTLPVYWRRRFPLGALLVSSVGVTTLAVLEYSLAALPVVVLFLAYNVAAREPLRRALVALVVIGIGLVVIWLADTPEFDAAAMGGEMALFAGAWLGGVAMRSRGAASVARLAEAEERAEAHRQQAARAVAEERLRIAQELHDVVAHSMSVIAVQAGMGVHVIDQQPADAKQALESISRTSRASLQEMRHLLGVLRGEDGGRAHVPAPGLSDLPALAERVRSAGVPVDVQVDGDATHVPLGVDLSAYRVVQESLTNVIKHAGPARALVHVRYEPREIVVEVSDDGRGVSAASRANGGHGLAGMKERVAVWGGTLEAGPLAAGGYRVLARLPYGNVA
jgi:signal transduction histidine kinase